MPFRIKPDTECVCVCVPASLSMALPRVLGRWMLRRVRWDTHAATASPALFHCWRWGYRSERRAGLIDADVFALLQLQLLIPRGKQSTLRATTVVLMINKENESPVDCLGGVHAHRDTSHWWIALRGGNVSSSPVITSPSWAAPRFCLIAGGCYVSLLHNFLPQVSFRAFVSASGPYRDGG